MWGDPRAEGQVDHQQRDADIDRGVGQIEHEEMSTERVKIEIVDDRPVRQSVEARCRARRR